MSRRIAILGDIHGNIDALDAVLAAIRKEGVSLILNTGDMVGYYYHPKRVLERLSEWPCITVRGNHEDMYNLACEDGDALSDITKEYGHGIAEALGQFTETDRKWIEALPSSTSFDADDLKITLAHGTPWSTDAYVYPDAELEKVEDILKHDNSDVVVLGHTHYQHLWEFGGRAVVNPGSVGQPRDRKPGAAWALLDTATKRIELRREDYDMSSVIDQANSRDPSLSYLRKVLTRK